MKKLFLLIILMLGVVLAEPVVGNAYVISALGIKNSSDNVAYVSGDTSVSGNANYVLAPQVIIYQKDLNYVGSYTPFTGCLNSQHYSNGEPSGLCFTGGLATVEQDGLMSKEDKAQLENLSKKMTNLEGDLYKNVLPVRVGGFPCKNISVLPDSTETYYVVNGTNETEEVAYFDITRYLELIPGETYKILGLPDDNPNIELLVRYVDSPLNIAGLSSYGSNSSLSDTFVYIKPI